MRQLTYFIIDFDSAFVTVESLEELAKIVLQGKPQKKKIVEQIRKITKQGMEGTISFANSLDRRLKLLKPKAKDLKRLSCKLKKNITPSIVRNKDFFKQYADKIYIISGGFKEFIIPVVKPYGISKDHVLANEFIFDKNNNIVGYNKRNPLAYDKGKVKTIKELSIKGKILVIGDGFTDYQIKEAGLAKFFYAYTENVYRQAVAKKADYIVPSFDEFLYINNLPRALSYPKHRIKALLLANIQKKAIKLLKNEGYTVEILLKSISEEELMEKIKSASILAVGSETNIPKKVLQNAKRLLTVGVFSLITSKIDLKTCTFNGAVVFKKETTDLALSQQLINFINTGETTLSINMPNLLLPEKHKAHRFIHIHKNIPGVLAKINCVLAKKNINIEGQYLKTSKEIGYLITDVNKKYSKIVVKQLKKVPGTIRLRVLY